MTTLTHIQHQKPKKKKVPAIQIQLENGKIIPFGKYSVKMARDYAKKGMEVEK